MLRRPQLLLSEPYYLRYYYNIMSMQIDFPQQKFSRKRKQSTSKKSTSKRSKKYQPANNVQAASEINFVDIAVTQTQFNAVQTCQLLNGLVPGTGEHNRLGRKITMKSVKITASIVCPAAGAAPAAFDLLRYAIVYDRQSNGALPAFGDIFSDTNNAGGATVGTWSSRNESNRDRFLILRDKPLKMEKMIGGGGVSLSYYQAVINEPLGVWRDYIRLKGLETHFNTGTAGTVADITSGALLLVVQGINAAADAQYSLEWQSRLYFTA